ncbi:MAG: peptidoglycan-binding protein [Dongiaceae bacterium]
MNRHHALLMTLLAVTACAAGLTIPLRDDRQAHTTLPSPSLIAANSIVSSPPQPSASVPLVWTNVPAEPAWPMPPTLSHSEQPASFELTREMISGMQRDLQRLGYDPGTADGVIGPRTQKAIQLFQQANGLDPDGFLTPALAEVLRTAP